jgi:hypothetical protein
MPIMMTASTAAIRSQGLIIDTTIKTAIALNPKLEANVAIPGRTRSITVMSLEKRVTIRPIGLESKNTILESRTALDIAWCMLDALKVIKAAMITASMNIKSIEVTIRIPKIIGYLLFYCSSQSYLVH